MPDRNHVHCHAGRDGECNWRLCPQKEPITAACKFWTTDEEGYCTESCPKDEELVHLWAYRPVLSLQLAAGPGTSFCRIPTYGLVTVKPQNVTCANCIRLGKLDHAISEPDLKQI